MKVNRQTRKYLVNRNEAPQFHDYFDSIAEVDKYAKDGVYHVRSLYFDDDDLNALKDRIAQKDNRKKFRIRLYNNDQDFIRLEEKVKLGDYGTKTGEVVSQEQVKEIIDGNIDWMKDSDVEVFKDFYEISTGEGELKPKVIIAYTREPFTQPEDGTRLTLDYDILASKNVDNFLETELNFDDLVDDKAVIEIKWTGDKLSDDVKEIVEKEHLEPVNFSKYTSAYDYLKS